MDGQQFFKLSLGSIRNGWTTILQAESRIHQQWMNDNCSRCGINNSTSANSSSLAWTEPAPVQNMYVQANTGFDAWRTTDLFGRPMWNYLFWQKFITWGIKYWQCLENKVCFVGSSCVCNLFSLSKFEGFFNFLFWQSHYFSFSTQNNIGVKQMKRKISIMLTAWDWFIQLRIYSPFKHISLIFLSSYCLRNCQTFPCHT